MKKVTRRALPRRVEKKTLPSPGISALHGRRRKPLPKRVKQKQQGPAPVTAVAEPAAAASSSAPALQYQHIQRPALPPIPGYSTRITPRGFLVVTLDYWADPIKSPEWAAKERRTMGDLAFAREHLRDWTSSKGGSFYPEFQKIPRDRRVVMPAGFWPDLPICRGWDFGFRRPSCTWHQYNPVLHMVVVWYELMPSAMGIDVMADVVKFLSGQMLESDVCPPAMAFLEQMVREGVYPPPPWFPPSAGLFRFQDYAGPEATKVSGTVPWTTQAKTDAEVLASKGILLQQQSMRIEVRETVMRRLLQVRENGWPGIIFSPFCVELVKGMLGGIAYPKATEQNPDPKLPKKDGHFENLHDALGYALVQTVPAVAPTMPAPTFHMQGRRRVADPIATDILPLNLKEHRHPIFPPEL